MSAMSTGVQYSKSNKEKNSADIAIGVNYAECNHPTMEKEILAIIKGIEKFLIFLIPKSFLIRTDCK